MEIHQRLLYQQLPFACSSSARELCAPLSGPCWGFMWLRLGLVHVVSMAVTSYAQLPCCVPRTLFPCIHLLPLALRLFLSPLPQWPLNLGRKAIHPRVVRWRKLVSIGRGRKNKGHKVLLWSGSGRRQGRVGCVYDKKYIIQKSSVVRNETEIEWKAVEVDVWLHFWPPHACTEHVHTCTLHKELESQSSSSHDAYTRRAHNASSCVFLCSHHWSGKPVDRKHHESNECGLPTCKFPYWSQTFLRTIARRRVWGGVLWLSLQHYWKVSAVIKHSFPGSSRDRVWSKQYKIVITLWEWGCVQGCVC